MSGKSKQSSVGHRSYRLPAFRTKLSDDFSEGKGSGYVEDQAHRGADYRSVETTEAGRKAEDVAREAGVSKHTIYVWKEKYGGMDVSHVCVIAAR
jgi:hypothetical protein